ncbi:tyrosine-type recombinase/integrase [Nanohaloarchaea archaeon]|nr:tyrosine-type recombinase/integrase [Candidatus Nanohaloarchaea archaeon]
MNTDISVDFDPDDLPEPQQVKKVAKNTKNLRDKAVILLLWSTGARVGEIFNTQYNDRVLKWQDLTFEDDKLHISIESGKTGARDIIVKTGMPILKRLWEDSGADLDDPVFLNSQRTSKCPRCNSKANLASSNTNPEYKKYSCSNCDWKGDNQEVNKEYGPLTDNAVRRIIERSAKEADLENEFDLNPHNFGRKSRAMYKARVGWSEHPLRAFFGWSETSDAPKHYLKCVKEDLVNALAEEYGEEVEYDDDYDEEALRPVECISCGAPNSPADDICRNCENPLTDQGEAMTKKRDMQGLKKNVAEIAKENDLDQSEFEEMLEEKSLLELIETIQNTE